MASTGAAMPVVSSPTSCLKKRAGAAASTGEVAEENPSEASLEKPPLANGHSRSLSDSTILAAPPSMAGASDDIDDPLRGAKLLTHVEVLRRRSRRAKALAAELRDHFWVSTEALRVKLRDYYWKFGVSPVEEGELRAAMANGSVCNGGGFGEDPVGLGTVKEENRLFGKKRKRSFEISRCIFPSCKAKGMALSSYCHQHILSDSNQTLYKPCSAVQKSGLNRTSICGKPVLQTMVPSLCSAHLQKSEKHLSQVLKKFGLITPPNMHPPKFHVIACEYVRQIQAKRKGTRKKTTSSYVVKDSKVE